MGWLMVCSTIGMAEEKDAIVQSSTIQALLEGAYDGDLTFQQVQSYGDTGIGTLNGLDGELIGLDGIFYQVSIDGKVHPVTMSMKTPFAITKFFKADFKIIYTKSVDLGLDFEELKKRLDHLAPNPNALYAFRVDGLFEQVKTRSVPKQKRPYPRLADAVKNQKYFDFKKSRGTLVGFRFPNYLKGINVPGYHFHYITKDRQGGGHVLTLKTSTIKIQVDESLDLVLKISSHKDIAGKHLDQDRSKELHGIETDPLKKSY